MSNDRKLQHTEWDCKYHVIFIPAPLAFSTEVALLSWLRETRAIAVPEVVRVSDDPPFLALERM